MRIIVGVEDDEDYLLHKRTPVSWQWFIKPDYSYFTINYIPVMTFYKGITNFSPHPLHNSDITNAILHNLSFVIKVVITYNESK